MMHDTLLSPNLLRVFEAIIVTIGVLVVAAQTGILAEAARRTGRNPLSVPLLSAAFLGGWLIWAVFAVRLPVVVPPAAPIGQAGTATPPMLLLVMALLVMASIVVLFASKSMRALNAATRPEWLIAVQSYRAAGVMFLWPFMAAGALPRAFALPAGLGDMATGLAAPIVALAIARGRAGARAWAVAWNCFGILDLIAAPIAAVLSHPTNIGRFPLVVVPLFLGPPIGILTHVYSLRNLAVSGRNRIASVAGSSAMQPRGLTRLANSSLASKR